MIYDMINSRKILVITDIIQNNISLIVTYGKSD